MCRLLPLPAVNVKDAIGHFRKRREMNNFLMHQFESSSNSVSILRTDALKGHSEILTRNSDIKRIPFRLQGYFARPPSNEFASELHTQSLDRFFIFFFSLVTQTFMPNAIRAVGQLGPGFLMTANQ